MIPSEAGGFPLPLHDHAACAAAALAAAERLCVGRGERLTPLRRRVLEIVWSDHRPLGAYEILRVLSSERGAAAPPTVYRALDFLLAQGLVHRVESLNAFIGCAAPGRAHAAQLFVCRACGLAAEVEDPRVAQAIARTARDIGFRAERPMLEVPGLCAACGAGEPPTAGHAAGEGS